MLISEVRPRPRTILQLIESWGPGGAETVVLELCRRLPKAHFYPIVGLLNDGWLNQQLIKEGVETIIIKNIRNNYITDLSSLWHLIKIIKSRNVDIVHSHEFMMNVYGTVAALLTRRPIIATIHGKNYFWHKRRRIMAYRFMSRYSSSVIAVSEDLKKFVVEKIGTNKNKISVIHNGINVDKFNGNILDNSLNNLKAFSETGPIIGTVGNLYPVKGYSYLFKAAFKVIKEFPDATFLIIGKPTQYLEGFKKEILDLNIIKNITFLGFRDDVPCFLKLIDIFVLPSLSEGLSLSILEAMAAGKPVIVSDVGGNPEIIRNQREGILIPPKDADALAQSIIGLIKKKKYARKLGEAARKRVKEKFSIENMVANYNNQYDFFKA